MLCMFYVNHTYFKLWHYYTNLYPKIVKPTYKDVKVLSKHTSAEEDGLEKEILLTSEPRNHHRVIIEVSSHIIVFRK